MEHLTPPSKGGASSGQPPATPRTPRVRQGRLRQSPATRLPRLERERRELGGLPDLLTLILVCTCIKKPERVNPRGLSSRDAWMIWPGTIPQAVLTRVGRCQRPRDRGSPGAPYSAQPGMRPNHSGTSMESVGMRRTRLPFITFRGARPTLPTRQFAWPDARVSPRSP